MPMRSFPDLASGKRGPVTQKDPSDIPTQDYPRVDAAEGALGQRLRWRGQMFFRRSDPGRVTVPRPPPVVRVTEIGVTHQWGSKIVASAAFPSRSGEVQRRPRNRREVTAWAKVWRREEVVALGEELEPLLGYPGQGNAATSSASLWMLGDRQPGGRL